MRSWMKYIVVSVFLSLSFFAQGKKRESGITLRDLGYVDSAAVIYYYTTGIAREMISGDLQQALHMYGEAIHMDSLFAPAYYQSALILANSQMDLAIEHSRKANAIDTANVWYKAQLGRLLIMNGEYEQAREHYSELIRLAPANPTNYRLLAALHEQTGQPFTAIAILDSAEYKLGRGEELSSLKRDLLLKVKLYDKAVEEAHALIRDYPYKADNYVFLGKVYALTNKDSLARASFLRAVELAPDDIGVLSELNGYYRVKGDVLNFLTTAKTLFMSDDITVEAKVSFYEDIVSDREFYKDNFFQIKELARALLLKYPYRDDVLDIYARTMYATGNIEQALDLYKHSLTDSSSMAIYANIIDLESYLKRPDSVILYGKRALERFPNSVEIYGKLSSSMSYLERYDKALGALKSGLKYADTDSVRSVFYGMMGDVYYSQNKRKESFSSYDRALRYWGDNVLVMNNYAYYLSEQGRQLEKALVMSQRVEELAPGTATYLDTHGWILYKLGRYAEAKKYVQQAISLSRGDNHVLHRHYGDILYALNDYFMAAFYWRKALEHGADRGEIEQLLKLVEGK